MILIREHVRSGTAPVHAIFDMRELKKFPTDLNLLRVGVSQYLNEPNMGWLVLIASSSTIRFFARAAVHVTKFRFWSVSNEQEAFEFLHRNDATLEGVDLTYLQ